MNKAATSEVDALEAAQGNPDSLHSANIIEIESSSESFQTSTSTSTSTSDSSDLDDVALNKIYKSLSPSTKLKKKPSDEPYEPLYPSVLDRIDEMSQMRVDLCAKLPADHPFQPPMIDCLQSIPADAEGVDKPAGSVSANISTSSHPNQPPVAKPLNFAPADAKTIGEQASSESANLVETSSPQPKSSSKSSEPSVLDQLVNHYSSELPGVESELEKAYEVASGEVASESPQQQTPNLQTASTTSPVILDHIESLSFTEQISEPEVSDMEVEISNSSSTSVPDEPSETNTPTIPTNNQPSTSNLSIQPCAPPRTTKVPSPPTLFLDSSILADVCENIFQELNKLIQARNDLIHKESYEKLWKRLKERVDYVLTELQRTCMDVQDSAQQKLQDWLKGVENNLQEVKVLRTWVHTPPCLRERNATDFIPAGIHPRELNVNWLTKVNVNPVSTELALLQRNAELEIENRQIRKELLEQKLLLLEYCWCKP